MKLKINSEIIMKSLYAKFNELEDLKKFIKDEDSINLINAKQDTLQDIINMVENAENRHIMNL